MKTLVFCILACVAVGVSLGRQECPRVPGDCLNEDVALLLVEDPDTVNQHKYFYVGGMFGVHHTGQDGYTKGPIRERGLQNMEMFFYALRTFRDRLSNPTTVKVGGIAFDSGSREPQTVENLIGFETCKVAYGKTNGTTSIRVDPRYVLAYVGPDRSGEVIQTALILKGMNKTQVSYANSALLENKPLYSYLLRTMPSSSNEARAMVQIMQEKEWKYMIALYSDTAYGKGLLISLKEAVEGTGICIVSQYNIQTQHAQAELDIISKLMTEKSAYVVAVLTEDFYARDLMTKFGKTPNVLGSFVFLGTNSWNSKPSVIADDNGVASGALTLAGKLSLYKTHVDQFKQAFRSMKPKDNHWNPWFTDFWENKFKCLLPTGTSQTNIQTQCTGNENLQTMYPSDDDFDVYLTATMMAVDSILQGADTARRDVCNQEGGVCSTFLNPDNTGNQIYERINQARLSDVPVFDQTTGGPNPNNYRYDVLNIKVDAGGGNQRYEKVGRYENGVLDIDLSAVRQYDEGYKRIDSALVTSSCPTDMCCDQRPRTSPTVVTTAPLPTTTADPTQGGKVALLYVDSQVEITGAYPADQNRTEKQFGTRFDIGSNWIIALGVLAGLGILAVLIFEIYIMTLILPNRATRQLRTMWLGQLLLLGIFLSYLTLFAFLFIPTRATCGITRFGVGVSYAILFSVLLVKLMVILTSRSIESTIPGDVESPNYLKGAYQLLLFLFATGVQIVIDIQWLIQVPPQAVRVTSNAGEQVWICNHYTWRAGVTDGMTTMSTFVRSEFENHLISLVYVMLLILITTIVALKAHGIITNHRESIFIGIAAGFSIPIWLAWTLVGGLNREHSYAHEYGDACIAFGLFVTASLVLFAMFLPKVRQLVNMGVEGIYLEDDRDTIYGSMYGGLPPPSYRSGKPGSVIYVNNQTGIYSEPINVIDPNSLYLRHPRTTSVYSAPPATYAKRPDSSYGTGSKVLKVTPDLTGRYVANGRHPQSEIAYPTARSTKSEKGGTLRRARSQEQIGSL